ncbi:MAG: hypothetical protein N3A61_00050 [Ignavibacteria bacterium]|nr:hypothetical protein [Ignavibacteria bacterium]
MKVFELRKSPKLILTIEDISKQLSITKESAKVTAVRYVRNGLLVRLKKDLYILSDNFKYLKEKDIFRLANMIQVPSYISLTTALSYLNISTQQLQNVV